MSSMWQPMHMQGSKGEFEMKEKYIKPEMEIVEFETEDIITASSDELPPVPVFNQ